MNIAITRAFIDRGLAPLLAGLILAGPVAAAPAPPVGVRSIAIDDEALGPFVRAYENAVNRRDADAINAYVSIDDMLERAVEGLDVPPFFMNEFFEGVREGLDWGRALAMGLGETGHYKLLRTRREGARSRALFRLVNDQGGLNYHDLVLGPGQDGEVTIVDVNVFLTGEMISGTVRRSLVKFLAADEEGDREYLSALALFGQMMQLTQDGRFTKALETYRRMPASMQQQKTVQVVRITCAAQVDDEELDRACNEFRRLFPDDPCVDLLTVDQLILKERWSEALRAFERLRGAVGGDAYVDDLMANVHFLRGDLEQAVAFARHSITREPGLDEGYWTLLEISLRRNDHDETARLLAVLERDFGWLFDDLDDVPAYGGFVTSDAYRGWASFRRVSGAE